MFDGDEGLHVFLVGVVIVVACIGVGAVVGGVYAGQIGAVGGGFAGAFVGGGVVYTVVKAFDAAFRNFIYVAPVMLIIGLAIWLWI